MRNALDHAEDDCSDDDLGRRQWLVAFLGMLLRRPHDTLAGAATFAAFATILANALFLQPNPHPAPIFSIKGKQISGVPRESTGAVALPRPRPPELTVRAEPVRRAELAASAEPAVRPEPAARALPTRPRNEIVSDIQRELARRGFYDGPVNGVHGGRTETAIREFEKSVGLPPSGEASESTLKTITRSPVGGKPTLAAVATPHADPSAAPSRAAPGGAVSDPGARAARTDANAPPPRADPSAAIPAKQVKAVQQALTDFGYGQVKPTGSVDAATRAAIETFEKIHKLPVTGQINEQFLRELVAVTDRPIE